MRVNKNIAYKDGIGRSGRVRASVVPYIADLIDECEGTIRSLCTGTYDGCACKSEIRQFIRLREANYDVATCKISIEGFAPLGASEIISGILAWLRMTRHIDAPEGLSLDVELHSRTTGDVRIMIYVSERVAKDVE